MQLLLAVSVFGFFWLATVTCAQSPAQAPVAKQIEHISVWHGEKVNDNPWEATTLEWTAPSPPPHGNFVTAPVVYRGPYEYSLPGREKDFTMQTEPVQPNERAPQEPTMSLSH